MRKQVLETCLCEVNFNYQDLFSINSSWESILFLVTASRPSWPLYLTFDATHA